MYSQFLTPPVANSLIVNANKIISLLMGDSPITEENLIPKEFDLKQNYPNPFNPSTTIEYTIPENSRVTLKIYDILGKEVATLVNKEQNTGTYIVVWNAQSVSSGIYFYRINAGNYTDTKRMILEK
jgi:flagellar hook assembly protein FlgD